MSNITPESIMSDLRYLQLLSRSFPRVYEDKVLKTIEFQNLFYRHWI
ncbi:fructose-1 6-bisphosphatase class 3 [Bacteroides cellulosilyticus CAG:158]|nr:fructose-1 6-bisphosphatase class 3 [Bacteroides cellulosilyticus CAG:158]